MLINFLKPVVNVEERLSIEKIKNEDNAISTFVICISDSPISFLSSGIPNLKLDLLTAMPERTESEVDANGGHVVLVELIICEPYEKAGLADAGITEKNHLEKMVVILSGPR